MPLFLKRYRRDRTLGSGSGSGGVAPVVLGGGAPTVEAVKALQQQVAELVRPEFNCHFAAHLNRFVPVFQSYSVAAFLT